MACPYCGTTVVVPEELRPHPVEVPHQPEEVTINIRPPQDRPDRPQITINVPPEELAQFQQAEATMLASQRARRGTRGCGCGGCFSGMLFLVALAGFIVFIFGFSIKNSVLYKCAVQKAQSNADVVRLIGAPIKADTFAWISNYQSSGSSEVARFTTQLSGPKGNGSLNVSGSDDRRGVDLDITFESGGKAIQVNSGPVKCQ